MKLVSYLRLYFLNITGVVAVLFGFVTPVIFSGVGLTVDMARAYLVQARLGQALDAAALAGAASGSDDNAAIEAVVNAYIEANYPDGRIGTVVSSNAELSGDELTVTASADVDTTFMRIFGYEKINIDAQTIVRREIRGLEVVMVLDNTGSMNTNDNISTLRTATQNFIQILFQNIGDPEYVRVGLVPYASSVNVGPYGLGIDVDGNNYDVPFVDPPATDVYADYYNGMNPYTENHYGIAEADLEYDPSEKGQWHGCVETQDYPLDTEDHAGPWTMYRHDFNGNSYYRNNDYFDGTLGDGYNAFYGPNIYCPVQPIVPLTSNEAFLDSAAGNMTASGATLGNFGMVWGWRVLSPAYPYTEGSAYDDNEWDKVALIMTDGDNTMSNVYSAYGLSDDHNIDAGDLDDRFAEICTAMKAQGILIYAITFEDGATIDQDTLDLFEQCATSPSNYKHAPSQEELVDTFEQIARELSNLFIRQ
ncbi:MAG: TadE/TadG family type IV pilus assembly protein [Pseudomonadota bacterium]